jgi:hypothetical protein
LTPGSNPGTPANPFFLDFYFSARFSFDVDIIILAIPWCYGLANQPLINAGQSFGCGDIDGGF